MELFERLYDTCIHSFGEEQVQKLAENQLEISIVNDDGEAMFPVYVGFHDKNDMELTAILFQVPEEDADAFMAQCNNLNTQYPWVKFYLESGYFCAGLDLLLYTGDVADVMSMLTALLQVISANLPGLLG